MFCIYWSFCLRKMLFSCYNYILSTMWNICFIHSLCSFLPIHYLGHQSLVPPQAYIDASPKSRIPLLQSTYCAHSTLYLCVFKSLSQAHLTNFCHSVAPESPGSTWQAAKVAHSLPQMACLHFLFPTIQGSQYLLQGCNRVSLLQYPRKHLLQRILASSRNTIHQTSNKPCFVKGWACPKGFHT